MSADRRHSLSSACFSFSGIEKTKLLDTDGRNFEKAEVTNVISGNLSNSGSGKQTVELNFSQGIIKENNTGNKLSKLFIWCKM